MWSSVVGGLGLTSQFTVGPGAVISVPEPAVSSTERRTQHEHRAVMYVKGLAYDRVPKVLAASLGLVFPSSTDFLITP